jgi:hypothetical protein
MLSLPHAVHTEVRTGWFAESTATRTLVASVIRTRRVPFFRSGLSLAMLLVEPAKKRFSRAPHAQSPRPPSTHAESSDVSGGV